MVLFVLLMKLPDLLGAKTRRRRRARSRPQVRGAGKAPLPGAADEFFGGPLPVARRTYLVEAQELIGTAPGRAPAHVPVRVASSASHARRARCSSPSDDLVLQAHDTWRSTAASRA